MRSLLGLYRKNPRAEQGALSLDEPIGEDIVLGDAIEADVDLSANFDHAEMIQAVRHAVSE